MSTRGQPFLDTPCSKAFLLGCLLCVCRATFGEDSKSNLTSTEIKHVKRSFDFPTLFYPGPDNKFITISPLPKLPQIINSNGQTETFQTSKSKITKTPNHFLSIETSLEKQKGHRVIMEKMIRKPEVENIIIRPETVPLNSFNEIKKVIVTLNSTPEFEIERELMRVDDRNGEKFLPMQHGQRLQKQRTSDNARIPQSMKIMNRYSTEGPSTSIPINVNARQSFKITPGPMQIKRSRIRQYIKQDVDIERKITSPTQSIASNTCKKLKPGYYADIESGCKVFYICNHGRKHTFVCPNKTLFNQQLSVCDWSQRVTCRHRSTPNLQQLYYY